MMKGEKKSLNNDGVQEQNNNSTGSILGNLSQLVSVDDTEHVKSNDNLHSSSTRIQLPNTPKQPSIALGGRMTNNADASKLPAASEASLESATMLLSFKDGTSTIQKPMGQTDGDDCESDGQKASVLSDNQSKDTNHLPKVPLHRLPDALAEPFPSESDNNMLSSHHSRTAVSDVPVGNPQAPDDSNATERLHSPTHIQRSKNDSVEQPSPIKETRIPAPTAALRTQKVLKCINECKGSLNFGETDMPLQGSIYAAEIVETEINSVATLKPQSRGKAESPRRSPKKSPQLPFSSEAESSSAEKHPLNLATANTQPLNEGIAVNYSTNRQQIQFSPRKRDLPLDITAAAAVSVSVDDGKSLICSNNRDNTVGPAISSYALEPAQRYVENKAAAIAMALLCEGSNSTCVTSDGKSEKASQSEHRSEGHIAQQNKTLLEEQIPEVAIQNDLKERETESKEPDTTEDIEEGNGIGKLKSSASEFTNCVQESSETSEAFDESDNSSLDSDDEDLIEVAYDIEARRKRNVKRNRQRMKDLGIYQSPSKDTKKKTESEVRTPEYFEEVTPRSGMLFSTAYNKIPLQSVQGTQKATGNVNKTIDCFEELYLRYPCRQSQIKMLLSMMGSSIRQASGSGDGVYVPAPIFVSGPSAVGKTSIVRDVVNTMKRFQSTTEDSGCTTPPNVRIGSAYINCATMEPSSIDALVQSAYRQLVEDSDVCHGRKRKKKRKKKSTNSSKAAAFPVKNKPPSPMDEENKFILHIEETENTDELEDKITRRLETVRKKPRKSVQEAPNEDNGRRKITRRSCDNTGDSVHLPPEGELEGSISNTSRRVEEKTAAHGAPVAFGRAIAPLFGNNDHTLGSPEDRGCAFLILDHAERLLTLSPRKKGSSEKNNYLAQFLLLPKVLGLNLTIIPITSSNLLEYSRVNNIAPTQKALGTIKDAVAPLRIHFPAYKGKQAFKDIFKRPEMKELITGRVSSESGAEADEFQKSIYNSFLDLLIQSLSGCTRNIREMIKLGRLWIYYIKPLSSLEVDETVETARVHLRRNGSSVETKDLHREITAMLNQRILPQIRAQLEKGFMLASDLPTSINENIAGKRGSLGLPFLSKCLMLSAFICQHNKADKDKKLFTKQRSGKRSNRKRNNAENNIAESLAYGSNTWEQQQLKMLRPRSFPLERMLSVFINITSIIEGGSLVLLPAEAIDMNNFMQSAGTLSFFESLAQLREIGVLRPVRDSATSICDRDALLNRVNLPSMKYWCELTQEDADEIAKGLDFPLFQFLL